MSTLPVRRCGCVGECIGHLRGSDEWWEATLEMMEDFAEGRPIPEKFTVAASVRETRGAE